MSYEMLREILRVRRISFLFLAFLALLNLALFCYLSFWQKPELAREQADWLVQREALARGQKVGDAARYEQGVRDLQAFRERLIPKERFVRFLGDLFQSAKDNSLMLRGITYKPAPITQEELLTYQLSFTVSGKYAAVKSFIADLARHRQMVTLDSVNLNSASQTEEMVDLKVQMTAYLKTEGA